jgi:hypothetical protein
MYLVVIVDVGHQPTNYNDRGRHHSNADPKPKGHKRPPMMPPQVAEFCRELERETAVSRDPKLGPIITTSRCKRCGEKRALTYGELAQRPTTRIERSLGGSQRRGVERKSGRTSAPLSPPNSVGAVGGLVGMIGGLGGFVLPIAFGALVDLTGLWTSCFMLLFLLVTGALIWMHVSIRQMERDVVGEALKKLPELPEMEEIHKPEHVGALSGVVLGMTIFLLFPFTRLVHIWSAPVWYLGRRGYQVVRSRDGGVTGSPPLQPAE